MDDTAYERQKHRVRALETRWRSALGLGWWEITFDWRRESCRTDPDGEPAFRTMMDVACRSAYLTACVNVYMPSIEALSDDTLEEVYLHEMAHVFTSPLQADAGDEPAWERQKHAREQVATLVGRAFAWAREAGQADIQQTLDREREGALLALCAGNG